jgi:hypothetical protein
MPRNNYDNAVGSAWEEALHVHMRALNPKVWFACHRFLVSLMKSSEFLLFTRGAVATSY